jgi:putative ubiquitin-RnfH superfamily antitoxin RatB of RatAB toxin-antitoxin module
MAASDTIEVEVVYALAGRQALLAITIPAGATAGEAVDQSGIAKQFPQHDFSTSQLGIWGRPVDSDQLLEDGDRVEIYRPLNIDPREARRKLATEGKSMGHQDSDDTES